MIEFVLSVIATMVLLYLISNSFTEKLAFLKILGLFGVVFTGFLLPTYLLHAQTCYPVVNESLSSTTVLNGTNTTQTNNTYGEFCIQDKNPTTSTYLKAYNYIIKLMSYGVGIYLIWWLFTWLHSKITGMKRK